MAIGFLGIITTALGLVLIAAVKLWSFVLWRVVPFVGIAYLITHAPQAFAEEDPYIRFTAHTLVIVHENKFSEHQVLSTRRLCMKAGVTVMEAVNTTEDDSTIIGFICEVEKKEQTKLQPLPVCESEERHCA